MWFSSLFRLPKTAFKFFNINRGGAPNVFLTTDSISHKYLEIKIIFKELGIYISTSVVTPTIQVLKLYQLVVIS